MCCIYRTACGGNSNGACVLVNLRSIPDNRSIEPDYSDEEIDETDHADYYNLDMTSSQTEVQVRHLEARIRELQATKGAFEREYEVHVCHHLGK